MINKGIMGQDMPFGLKCENFGPLLQGSEWKHAEAVGRHRGEWEIVKGVGMGQEGPGEVQK